MSLLTVKDLSVKFPTEDGLVNAVNGVSFSVEKGKTLGIVGESGCGKSQTALSIMRLIQKPGIVESGEVTFKNENLLKKSDEEMREIMGNPQS